MQLFVPEKDERWGLGWKKSVQKIIENVFEDIRQVK